MKRTVLTLFKKNGIIPGLEKGVSITSLAKKYVTAKSTFCTFKMNLKKNALVELKKNAKIWRNA